MDDQLLILATLLFRIHRKPHRHLICQLALPKPIISAGSMSTATRPERCLSLLSQQSWAHHLSKCWNIILFFLCNLTLSRGCYYVKVDLKRSLSYESSCLSCCRYVYGDQSYPDAYGKTRKEAREEAARLVYLQTSEEQGVWKTTHNIDYSHWWAWLGWTFSYVAISNVKSPNICNGYSFMFFRL